MDEPGDRPRVIVADDAALLRDGVARILDDAGFDVIAAVADAQQLIEAARTHQPDIVIVDIRMPPTHTTEGLQAATTIRQMDPDIKILMLSQYVEPRYAVELLQDRNGGVGYLLKDRITDSASFVESVRHVNDGGSAIDPQVVSQLLNRRRQTSPLESLTDREREVLQLMAEGRSNRAIADTLHISPKTLETHIGSVLQKLDLPVQPDDHRRVLAVLTYLRETP